MTPFRFLARLLLVAGLLGAAARVRAQESNEGFEGPDVSWKPVGADMAYRIADHSRVHGEAHTGSGCERITVRGSAGTYVYFSHTCPTATVIEDLVPTVWVKASRPGPQLLAEIVLPRTADPRTGRAMTVLVPGAACTMANRWEPLRLADLPTLIERQVRVLRTQFAFAIDAREAQLSRILLNVYAGPGETTVWIDDLEWAGVISPGAVGCGWTSPTASPGGTAPAGQASGPSEAGRVRFDGSVLLVNDQPILPRLIEYRGESLEFLRQIGLNGVWLHEVPSAEFLRQAEQNHLGVVCPPPGGAPDPASSGRLPAIGPEFRTVLAWNLGEGLAESQLESVRAWAEVIRRADSMANRPLVCEALAELRAYSREADLLVLRRRPLGSTLELRDYATWVATRPRLARLGTPVWTTVATQLPPALVEQLAALEPARPVPCDFSIEQMRLQVYAAIANGSRGILYESQTRLDATDVVSQTRAMAVQLLNLELALIESWPATGSTTESVEGSHPQIAGALFQREHARLLLPVWLAPGAQYAPGQSAGNNISLKVPGIPEASKIYEISAGGLAPLRLERVTRGTQITLEEFGLTGMVLISQDPRIVGAMTKAARSVSPQMAQLQRNLATWQYSKVEEVDRQLKPRATASAQTADWMDVARENLRWCDEHLLSHNWPQADLTARRAARALRLVERAHWEAAVAEIPSPLSSPGASGFATLPWHWALMDRIRNAPSEANRLPAGDFEDLGSLQGSGWQHCRPPDSSLVSRVELTAAAVHGGKLGLAMSVQAAAPEQVPGLVETPPVWITSPAIPVEAGRIYCVRGWVRVQRPIVGSVDGLTVIDSIGGEALTERIGRTNGWQEFVLYRVAPRTGSLSVTFALTGLGEAWLDDVTVTPFETPAGALAGTPQPVGPLGNSRMPPSTTLRAVDRSAR